MDKNYLQCSFQIYRTKQEILDIRESEMLHGKIRTFFNNYNGMRLALTELKAINDIIDSSIKP